MFVGFWQAILFQQQIGKVFRSLQFNQGRRLTFRPADRWQQTLFCLGMIFNRSRGKQEPFYSQQIGHVQEFVAMDREFRRGFTTVEKTELWDRWQRGESLKAIGRAFGKPSSSIYFQVSPYGGIRPAPKMTNNNPLARGALFVAFEGMGLLEPHRSAHGVPVSVEVSRNSSAGTAR
jgi:hypothetical protein